ncbi:hypothetical protein A2U01_0091920, partial [Trifolium medium]|nr:hypothetical protein [Trifolium medium]
MLSQAIELRSSPQRDPQPEYLNTQ